MSDFIFQCVDCSKEYLPGDVEYTCPSCSKDQKRNASLKGVLRAVYNYDGIKGRFGVDKLKRRKDHGAGRYKEILPFSNTKFFPDFIVGQTPLRRAINLGHEIGLNDLWLKDDTILPTCSFKDRASVMVAARARELGAEKIVAASTGNAASSIAAVCASIGLECMIFAPESAPAAKLAQISVCGSNLVLVKGSYDDAFEQSIEATKKFGWYNRNTAYNPYTIEGKKTAALEIWEQFGYSIPDKVVVPVGDGCILAGIEKGFYDLMALGLADRLPQLIAVQAVGSPSIVRAHEAGFDDIEPMTDAKSIADSIVVNAPRNARWALKALKQTNGIGVLVSDEEIVEAIKITASFSGVFAEPAAAAAIAGIKKLVKEERIIPEERVVALITGHGLKDVGAVSSILQ